MSGEQSLDGNSGSREAAKAAKDLELEVMISSVVHAGFEIHRDLGPGLLESVYEAVLARKLQRLGYKVEHQKSISFHYDGVRFEEGLKVDLLIEDRVPIELKSVEAIAPVHLKQLLSYLRLLQLPLGILVNFGGATYKQNVKRVINSYPAKL